MTMHEIPKVDLDHIAIAGQLVAAIAADDTDNYARLLHEIPEDAAQTVITALATRTAHIAKEFYDTDAQVFLDGYAFGAIDMAERGRNA